MTPSHQTPTPKRSKLTTPQDQRSQATFRKRIRSGNYEALLGRGMRRTLQAAAADTSLDLEIGALRLALVRLLREEPGLPRLAAGIARLSGVALLASRQRADSSSPADDLRQTFLRELELYEKELEAYRVESTSTS